MSVDGAEFKSAALPQHSQGVLFYYLDITILDQYDKKHYLEGLSGKGLSKIFVTDSDIQEVIDIFETPGKISMYMKYSKYTVSTYLFEIDTTGFYDLYQQIQ